MEKYGWIDAEALEKQKSLSLNNKSDINYPLQTLQTQPVEKPLNIVFIVIDSWRADTFNADTSPNMWNFAQSGKIFNNHISSGNATRTGIFGLFYGIPGTYWHAMLANHKSPVFIDRLQTLNYDLGIFAAAKLTNPEFHQTVFSKVPNLRVSSKGNLPSELDQDLTKDWVQWFDHRDKYKTKLSYIMPLMLRMSDNVEIIAKKAFSLSVSAVKNADTKNFSIYLPILEHLSRSARVNNLNFQYISDNFADKLKKEISAMDVTDIAQKITEPKSLLLRFAGKYPVFSYEQTKQLISTVRNEQQKTSLFKSMINFYKDSFSPDEYLSDKCRRIRYTAANYKYETEGLPWDGLYDVLLDNSSSLRELAVYVLKKHYGLNAHDYYSDKLCTRTRLCSYI